MTDDHPSAASDPDGIPYVPAWSDATPPSGPPSFPGPAGPPPAEERHRHRGPRDRPILFSPVVLALTALLLAVLGVGAYLYFDEDKKRGLAEGRCVNDLSGNKPNITDCEASGAKYQIVEIFRDTIDYGQCNSVAGANIPLLVDDSGRTVLLCVMKIA